MDRLLQQDRVIQIIRMELLLKKEMEDKAIYKKKVMMVMLIKMQISKKMIVM